MDEYVALDIKAKTTEVAPVVGVLLPEEGVGRLSCCRRKGWRRQAALVVSVLLLVLEELGDGEMHRTLVIELLGKARGRSIL